MKSKLWKATSNPFLMLPLSKDIYMYMIWFDWLVCFMKSKSCKVHWKPFFSCFCSKERYIRLLDLLRDSIDLICFDRYMRNSWWGFPSGHTWAVVSVELFMRCLCLLSRDARQKSPRSLGVVVFHPCTMARYSSSIRLAGLQPVRSDKGLDWGYKVDFTNGRLIVLFWLICYMIWLYIQFWYDFPIDILMFTDSLFYTLIRLTKETKLHYCHLALNTTEVFLTLDLFTSCRCW